MHNIKKILSILMICSVMVTGCGRIEQEKKDAAEISNTEQPQKEIYTAKVTPEEDFNDGEHIIGFVGLKEYDKLKSKQFKDIPAKGKKYLVLFLKCGNGTQEQFYINEAALESKLDGKKLDHTILFNDPEGYPTFFRNFKAGSKDYGFIVWEVPKDWKTLDITYTGLEYVTWNRIEMSFTRENLVNPPLYKEIIPK